MNFAAAHWLLLLLLLPVLWLLVKASDRRTKRRLDALLGPRAAGHREGWHPQIRGWRRFFFLATLAWLIVALARPQWGASEVTVTQRGRDVVIALDISNSMLAEDVTPNRLERAKAELTTFLRAQGDSRIGLVLFAGAAFVQCPLTSDYATCEIFLEMASPDMISAQGTALASALQVGRELLASGRESGASTGTQAILLVTDGEDLEGDWEAEARACADQGIVVIPVGIGEETGGLIPVTDSEGRPDGFLKDEEGQLVLSRIDLASLERLAAIGGGSTFRVGLDGLAGERLRAVLARLEAQDFEERQVTAWQERYHWPLLLALVSLVLAVLLRPRRVATARALAVVLAVVAGLMASDAGAEVIRPAGADAAERGRQAYAAGRYEEALQEFETARTLAPDDPRLALAVGETLARLERWDEATREFDRARDLTTRRELQAESLYNAGTVALAQGQADSASTLLRESLRLEPDREDALRNLEAALMLQQQQDQQQDQQQEQQQEQQQQNQDEQQNQNQDQQQQEQERDGEQEPQDPAEQQPEPTQPDSTRQDQQQQPDQAESQEPPAEATPEPLDEEELDWEEEMQLLRALDREEQELKRSIQKRLRGERPKSGKRW